MKENISALYSEYIIDGVSMELTPAMMLDSCLVRPKPREARADRPSSSRVALASDTATDSASVAILAGMTEMPPAAAYAPIVDESLDPGLCSVVTDSSKLKTYIKKVKEIKVRKFSKAYAGSCTRSAIARSLVDVIWREGHFRLGDLAVRLDWQWPTDHVGDFAAFYESVSSAADYIDSLGLKISDYSFTETDGDASLTVSVNLQDSDEGSDSPLTMAQAISAFGDALIPDTGNAVLFTDASTILSSGRFGFANANFPAGSPVSEAAGQAASAALSAGIPTAETAETAGRLTANPASAALTGLPATDDDIFNELPFKTSHPSLGPRVLHPSKLQPDAQSWLIYVPFDDCDYRLAGSLLAQALGISGAAAPQIDDADYFIDCYEVVRELVEDGIVLSGTTVGDGGLISAIKNMTGSKVGADIELSDLVRATGEKDIIRLLFSEVPGAVFQIADIDYDYVDAELLLQDVAFYSLGHPVPGTSELRVHSSEKSGLQIILESIIRSQNSEGED